MAPADDPLIRWAQQAVPERGERYDAPGAAVVAATGLFRRDRLVVAGDPAAVAPLAERAARAFPGHIVIGASDTVVGLDEMGVLRARPGPGWMELVVGDRVPVVDHDGVQWLGDDEVAPVLTDGNPSSWVEPGDAAVTAWAGATAMTPHGPELAAVGALAWCAPDVGVLGGVATRPQFRGRGLSTRVCGALRDEALARYATAALLVDRDNAAAVSVYRRLGFRYRQLALGASITD